MTTPAPTNDTPAPRWTAEPSEINDATDIMLDGDPVAECHQTNKADHRVTAQRLAACADKLREFGEIGECVVERWVPCSEAMPDEHRTVIVSLPSAGIVMAQLRDGSWWGSSYAGIFPCREPISHWMALPTPSPAKG